jgi:hypothetical protein
MRTVGTSFVIWKEGGRGSRKDGMGRTSFIEDDLLYDATCRRKSRTSVHADFLRGRTFAIRLDPAGWLYRRGPRSQDKTLALGVGEFLCVHGQT